jgi:hypothetical protein
LVAAVLLAAAAFLRTRTQAEQLPPREQLASFPMRVGDWTGREVGVSEAVRDFLGDGDFMDRVYLRRPEEPYVDLYIAYFPTQRTGNTIHSPQNCLPGAGWTPVERGRVVLKGPMGETVRANRYIIAKGSGERVLGEVLSGRGLRPHESKRRSVGPSGDDLHGQQRSPHR